MPDWLTALRIDTWQDLFRVINGVLALLAAGGLMFDRYAPWRSKASTQKLLTFSVAGAFAWQAFTSIEIVWLLPPASVAVGDYGIRVYGFTVWFILVLLALAERHRRIAAWEAHTRGTDDPVIMDR